LNSAFRRDALEVIDNLADLNDRFAGKTVLLTGAAGFLGVNLVHYFIALNQSGRLSSPVRLIALDNFIRGMPDWIAELEGTDNAEFRKADVVEPLDLREPIDFIIHAASIASPLYYRQHPIETMDANVIGLRQLLDHASAKPVESILFFSTSEIYGDPDPSSIPTPESYRGYVSCTGPRACYDESKRFGETLCVSFWQVHKVPVKIARPFNNYGPGLKLSDRRVLPDFFSRILAGQDIELLSDGSPTRTFCYISDAITGYLRILLSDHNGEAFNIGAVEPEISMRDLARLCIDVSGAALDVVHADSPDRDYLTDNPNRRCPDMSKSRAMLGFEARVGLEEGLRRSFEWYRTAPRGEDA
jgi:dTDP-glucose 4,6-dehydratase/UDP-glucuronate decarboxylase